VPSNNTTRLSVGYKVDQSVTNYAAILASGRLPLLGFVRYIVVFPCFPFRFFFFPLACFVVLPTCCGAEAGPVGGCRFYETQFVQQMWNKVKMPRTFVLTRFVVLHFILSVWIMDLLK
jgi:hypothetical protein